MTDTDLREEILKGLEPKIQKHLESAITHGYNDAQVDNDGLGKVCRMEAQQNLRNTLADISQAIDQAREKERGKVVRDINYLKHDHAMLYPKRKNCEVCSAYDDCIYILGSLQSVEEDGEGKK